MGLHVQATHPVHPLPSKPTEFTHTGGPAKFSNPTPVVKASPRSPSIVIVDSPNATRTVCDVFGRGVKPDWGAVLGFGRRHGRLVAGIAAVNDGLPEFAVGRLRGLGYSVHFSHARDVDDCVVSQIIRRIDCANTFVLVSGDGGYCSLVRTLRRLSKHVIIVAVERRCNRKLRKLADEFHPLPVVVKSGDVIGLATNRTPVPTALLCTARVAESPACAEGRRQ